MGKAGKGTGSFGACSGLRVIFTSFLHALKLGTGGGSANETAVGRAGLPPLHCSLVGRGDTATASAQGEGISVAAWDPRLASCSSSHAALRTRISFAYVPLGRSYSDQHCLLAHGGRLVALQH